MTNTSDLVPPTPTPTPLSRPDKAAFDTTKWTVVMAAGREEGEAGEFKGQALSYLCERYWYPLYSYVRRQGHTHEDAQDFTQGFFHHILRRDAMGVARPERGRFRTFLLGALRNYLRGEYRRARTLKRGGGLPVKSLEDADWDERYRAESAHVESPERLYHRAWASTLIEYSLAKLEREYGNRGRRAVFDRLKDYVGGGDLTPDGAFADTGLGVSPGTLAQTLHRMRRRFREILREQVRATLTEAEDLDDEIRFLWAAL